MTLLVLESKIVHLKEFRIRQKDTNVQISFFRSVPIIRFRSTGFGIDFPSVQTPIRQSIHCVLSLLLAVHLEQIKLLSEAGRLLYAIEMCATIYTLRISECIAAVASSNRLNVEIRSPSIRKRISLEASGYSW